MASHIFDTTKVCIGFGFQKKIRCFVHYRQGMANLSIVKGTQIKSISF